MYQQFYGLRDIPFSLAPDPSYLFRTESLLEVFANLQYGIENGKGLVVVTGEVGNGKTTILRSMLQSLDRSVLAAYIFNPLLATGEFFDLLTGEFRLRVQPSKAAMLRMLGYMLMTRHSQGLRTVLVVDEAHLLPAHLLEEIRLLSNFETNREKLLQIILCGQPELHEVLAQPELRQLKQRVSLKCSLKPLAARETAEYILWRLRVAGAKNENLFEPDAIRMIHSFSGGIPRIINNICDNALLTGFGAASSRITASIIGKASFDLPKVEAEPSAPFDFSELIALSEMIAAAPRREVRSQTRPRSSRTSKDLRVATAAAPAPVSDLIEPRQAFTISKPAVAACLTAVTGEDTSSVERYRTLAVRLLNQAAKRKLKTVVITSARGQEGKSTVATNLAWAMAKPGERRVLLIDANPDRPRSAGCSASTRS